MDASSGDAVVVDAGLQDPPSLLPEMIAGYCEGCEVVCGQRTEREGETWLKRATASVFYSLMRRFVDRRLPPDAGDFRSRSERWCSTSKFHAEVQQRPLYLVRHALNLEREPR